MLRARLRAASVVFLATWRQGLPIWGTTVTNSSEELTLVLPSVIGIAEAEGFHGTLDEAIKNGGSYGIDAAAVERIDTSIMQQLLCFRAELQRQGLELKINAASEAFANAVRLLGLSALLECPPAGQE